MPSFHKKREIPFFRLMLLAGFAVLCLSPRGALAACNNPAGSAGEIIYNDTAKLFQYCNDTDWVRMTKPGTGSGGCTNPNMNEGDLVYNQDARVLQGCTGNVHTGAGAVGGAHYWKQISVGNNHYCGIKDDDRLYCWGANTSGQIGNNSVIASNVPVEVSGGGQWRQVSAGHNMTCGITSDDKIKCWGGNASGGTGLNTSAGNTLIPTEINGGGSWKSVSVGKSSTYKSVCAIKSDDKLWCWGYNGNGQLGDNSTTNRLVPTAIAAADTWLMVDSGGSQTCGIKSDNKMFCWGNNYSGATGRNTSTGNTLTPMEVTGSGSWKFISVGQSYGCGLKSDDTLWCWGNNATGQLGDNSTTNRLVPTAISGSDTWKMIAAGQYINSFPYYYLTCGIKTDDKLYCWGGNGRAVTGLGLDSGNTLIPTQVGTSSWQTISTGASSCGIRAQGDLQCWGSDGADILEGTAVDIAIPQAVSGNKKWLTVNTGGADFNWLSPVCAVADDNTGWCWGENYYGQVGNGTSESEIYEPTLISGGHSWKMFAGGREHACGIRTDDTLWCWGDNNVFGRLGDNSTAQRLVPTAVSGGGAWKYVSAGDSHTCGIKADDTLWCWGGNSSGKTGLNTTTGNTLVPTQVTGGGAWKYVSAGNGHSCGIKADDTLWCWGSNSSGKTGLNTDTGTTLIPTEIYNGGSWSKVSATDRYHSCGLKTDGTAWCWGAGWSGQLGQADDNYDDSSIPLQVAGGDSWIDLDVGSDFSCGLKSDHTAWCWGDGYGISSGDPDTPEKIDNSPSWAAIDVGDVHGCLISKAGQLWCWSHYGYNSATGRGADGLVRKPTSAWCRNPLGPPGEVLYNSDLNIMQYCDGVGWVAVRQ